MTFEDFQFCTAYLDDEVKFQALNAFAIKSFGLDFTDWAERGFRESTYTPFSYFKNEMVISNVSFFSTDVVIAGETHRAAQISTCATLEEYRRNGLASKLLNLAIEEAKLKHDFIFLMSTDEAIRFYTENGFTSCTEYFTHFYPMRVAPKRGLRKLDARKADEFDLITQLAKKREPVSNLCGVVDTPLLVSHCLYWLRDCIYHIPGLNCIILFNRRGRRLRIFDIVAEKMPPFDCIYPYLTKGRRDKVEFMFAPDKMELIGLTERLSCANNLHYWGTPPPFQDQKFLIPFTSHA